MLLKHIAHTKHKKQLTKLKVYDSEKMEAEAPQQQKYILYTGKNKNQLGLKRLQGVTSLLKRLSLGDPSSNWQLISNS